ncbi:MAG: DUF4145 domain-containing protein [Nitratireductor sp.]|nr:DUF4145 domain-containing protein [Nitratireductor sp.]
MKLIVYPPALFSDIPPDLPESVERAYRQAERNRVQPDCEEPAATGYRRAIENAIKEKHPETKGPLRDRIRKLGDSGNLPKDMVAWAHQVRILGNDGAHELDGVTREEVEQARGFADAFLRYLISMPVMVEQVRKKTAVPAEAEVEPATEVGEISAAEG